VHQVTFIKEAPSPSRERPEVTGNRVVDADDVRWTSRLTETAHDGCRRNDLSVLTALSSRRPILCVRNVTTLPYPLVPACRPVPNW
jgi:hypothetical protein